MFTSEIEVVFENGSRGYKVFEAKTRELVNYDVDYYLHNLVKDCMDTDNRVASHKITTKTSNSWVESHYINELAQQELDFGC